jgi:type VI protein secretion system component VasK
VSGLSRRFFSHIDVYVVLFGAIAVAAFWFAIQLCWSVAGKRWYSAAWRLLVALVLFGVGFVMIFFTAFGI